MELKSRSHFPASRYVLCIVAASLCVAGCSSSRDVRTPVADAVFELALVTATAESAPAPDPNPNPKPSVCPDCNGTGQVGDGTIFAKCLRCDGTGRIPQRPAPASDAACRCEPCLCTPCNDPCQSDTSSPAGVAIPAFPLSPTRPALFQSIPDPLPDHAIGFSHYLHQRDDETFDRSRNVFWRRDNGPRREDECHDQEWNLYWRPVPKPAGGC
jgi:hypothetical protein